MENLQLQPWIFALPILIMLGAALFEEARIVATNLGRAMRIGTVGGVSTALVVVAAADPTGHLIPLAVASGAVSVAGTTVLHDEQRAWFGKRLSGLRWKRVDRPYEKSSPVRGKRKGRKKN